MALVTQGMNPQASQQRERTDSQTVGMLLDLIRTLAPKFQKNLMPKSSTTPFIDTCSAWQRRRRLLGRCGQHAGAQSSP